MASHIPIDDNTIAEFRKRWRITEFALFGSVLREDFSPDSDIDVLVTFTPEARYSLLDLTRIENELTDLLRRKADLVERQSVEQSENYIRRKHVLENMEPIYVE